MLLEILEKRGRIVVDGVAIRRKSGWDGYTIWETENCERCAFKKTIEGKTTGFNLCLWGVAWKIILEAERVKKCAKAKKPSPASGWRQADWEKYYFMEEGAEPKPGIQFIFPKLDEIMKPPGKAAIGVGRRRIAYDKPQVD